MCFGNCLGMLFDKCPYNHQDNFLDNYYHILLYTRVHIVHNKIDNNHRDNSEHILRHSHFFER